MTIGGIDYWALAGEADMAAGRSHSIIAQRHWHRLATQYRDLAEMIQQANPSDRAQPTVFVPAHFS